MATTTIIKHLIAVLKFPRGVTNFITYAKAIYETMHADALFAALAAKLATLDGHIGTMDDTETATKTKPPTMTVEDRDAAIEVVKGDLRILRNDVQNIADATPANSEAIITASGMKVKKITIRGKQQNTARQGTEDGSIILTAEGAGQHDWRRSTDEINWTLLPSTKGARTTDDGLTSGVKYFYQNRQVLTKGRKTAWSQSVSAKPN